MRCSCDVPPPSRPTAGRQPSQSLSSTIPEKPSQHCVVCRPIVYVQASRAHPSIDQSTCPRQRGDFPRESSAEPQVSSLRPPHVCSNRGNTNQPPPPLLPRADQSQSSPWGKSSWLHAVPFCRTVNTRYRACVLNPDWVQDTCASVVEIRILRQQYDVTCACQRRLNPSGHAERNRPTSCFATATTTSLGMA